MTDSAHSDQKVAPKLTNEDHAAQLAEFLAKHIHMMGLDTYEAEPQHYGWHWKVTVTRLGRTGAT